MRKFCKKHRTILGCIAAGTVFVALHVIVPGLTAFGVARHAHAAPVEGGTLIFEHKGVSVHVFEFNQGLGTTCLIGVVEGRKLRPGRLDIECF